MGWVCAAVGGVVVLLFVAFFVAAGGHYKRMFGGEHLMEFTRGVADLKSVVLADIEDESDRRLPDPNDRRALRTSAGLVLFYTITRHGAAYCHHYSLRDAERGYTAHATGSAFTLLTAAVLGVDPHTLGLERSENRVYHAEFMLDEAQQAAFVARPPRLPASNEDAIKMSRSTFDLRDKLTFRDITTGMPFVR